MDVTFREDCLRVYAGHATTNLSIVMRVALGLLKNENSVKGSMDTKRLTAGWDEGYLEKVLLGSRDKKR